MNSSQPLESIPTNSTLTTTSCSSDTIDQPKCPVDHSQLKKDGSHPFFQTPHPSSNAFNNHTATTSLSTSPTTSKDPLTFPLSKEREVSSIPRSRKESIETATTSTQGTHEKNEEYWMYPSEEMFYKAMLRKKWDPKMEDMKVVVPIHNAVNEMAWNQILTWEKFTQCDCPSIKLVNFKGRPNDLTPKARFRIFTGAKPPFDRHDWQIDRCGEKVNYIIDFYSGQVPSNSNSSSIASFFLDVRPKLDSWQNLKLRMYRFWKETLFT